MKRLEIQETTHGPRIILDGDKSIFLIEGKSFPEDSKQFYQPVLDWLEEYKTHTPEPIDFHINLVYLSSSSIISIKQILMKLKDYHNAGWKVVITWHSDEDDDDIKKTGEDYMRITNLRFQFKENNS